MRLLNTDKYPIWVQNALNNDSYDPGVLSSKSGTTLIDSAKIKKLQKDNFETLEEDASRRIAALFGSAIHLLAEQNCPEDWITEERFYAKVIVDGKDQIISGQIDALEPLGEKDVMIWDWKTIPSYKAMSGMDSYVKQGNIYAFLLRQNGYNPKGFKIGAWLKDWKASQAKRNPDYPQIPFMTYEYELWDDDKCNAYVQERCDMHFGDLVHDCTDEDMWTQPVKWEALKKGNKSPTKLFDTMEDGLDWLKNGVHPKLKNSQFSDWVIKKREAVRTRCEENYCGVNQFCDQYKDYLKSKEERA